MTRSLLKMAALFLVPLIMACCAGGDPTVQGKKTDTRPLVRDILASPASFDGTEVSLEAKFAGWSGKCTSGPPKARSDWMGEDDTGCIYIHGPLPAGLSAPTPLREPVSVRGTVRLDRNGTPFIDLAR